MLSIISGIALKESDSWKLASGLIADLISWALAPSSGWPVPTNRRVHQRHRRFGLFWFEWVARQVWSGGGLKIRDHLARDLFSKAPNFGTHHCSYMFLLFWLGGSVIPGKPMETFFTKLSDSNSVIQPSPTDKKNEKLHLQHQVPRCPRKLVSGL